MTITIAPLTTTVFDSAPNEMSGTASGINNAAARAGSLVAIAALGLAFGAAASPDAAGSALASAYRAAMIAAAVLAGLSALTAALTIRPRTTPNTTSGAPGFEPSEPGPTRRYRRRANVPALQVSK